MGNSFFVRFMGMEATVCPGSGSGVSFVRKATDGIGRIEVIARHLLEIFDRNLSGPRQQPLSRRSGVLTPAGTKWTIRRIGFKREELPCYFLIANRARIS